MDPRRAAELLGVETGASSAQVSAAFARVARRTHPDVTGGDDGGFKEALEARDTLLALARAGAAAPRTRADGRRVVPASEGPAPRPQGPALLAAWVAILAVAAFLSIYGVPHPLAPWEPLVRWVLLTAAGLAFALTGRRWLLVAAVLLLVVSLITTLLFTTLGGLVGVLIALPALYGLALAGFARGRLLRAAGTAAARR